MYGHEMVWDATQILIFVKLDLRPNTNNAHHDYKRTMQFESLRDIHAMIKVIHPVIKDAMYKQTQSEIRRLIRPIDIVDSNELSITNAICQGPE
jgi:hypothetical protein